MFILFRGAEGLLHTEVNEVKYEDLLTVFSMSSFLKRGSPRETDRMIQTERETERVHEGEMGKMAAEVEEEAVGAGGEKARAGQPPLPAPQPARSLRADACWMWLRGNHERRLIQQHQPQTTIKVMKDLINAAMHCEDAKTTGGTTQRAFQS